MRAAQCPDQLKAFNVRLTFRREGIEITYGLVRLQTVSAGIAEATLRNATPLPFELTFPVDIAEAVVTGMQYVPRFAGLSSDVIHRAARALCALELGGELEAFNLESDRVLFRLRSEEAAPEWLHQLVEFSRRAMAVQDFYGVDLLWPAEPSVNDFHSLDMLYAFIHGMKIPISNISMSVVKRHSFTRDEAAKLVKGSEFMIGNDMRPPLTVFGEKISPEPVVLTFSGARIMNRRAVADFLVNAPVGSSADVKLACSAGAVATAVPRSHAAAARAQ